jgi:hypothetical protein
MKRIALNAAGVAALAFYASACASGGTPAPAAAPTPAPPETVVVASTDVQPLEPGRFDMGKMWTLENAPVEYFEEAYGFRPTQEWLDHVRMASLRIPGCTASFVSFMGLVMTNHHCARGHVSRVTREGEGLLDDGFFAETLEDERPVPNMWVDRMERMEDVTALIETAVDPTAPEDAQAAARRARIEAVADSAGSAHGLRCEVASLYQGGMYSMYCFTRFTDVRLVFAPELQIGYFGGDPDNFTYPRYNLDVSFFRVYEDGEPYEPPQYYGWSEEGAAEGDAVFVIGNPGSTERLSTFAQLEFNRDHREPFISRLLRTRTDILAMYMEHHPETRDEYINQWFGWMNGLKLYDGRTLALNDPEIMGRKLGWEQRFRADVAARPELQQRYGSLWEDIAGIREQMAEAYPTLMALQMGGGLRSQTLAAASGLLQYAQAAQAGAPDSVLRQMRSFVEGIEIEPDLDGHMLEAQIGDVVFALGEDDPWVQTALAGRSPRDAAQAIIEESSSIVDPEARRALLDDPTGIQTVTDPALALAREAMPRMGQASMRFQQLNNQEEALNRQLARALFDVHGTDLPPDATFTLRIADGVVASYEYNGTKAPTYTTFYGLYDRHYAHKGADEWALPDRWLDPPADFDMGTPLNMVSTNDITGGNSGSPVINIDLDVVGLIFDGNIESLSGDFIYTTEVSRTVSVCAEGILEAMRSIYGAQRLVTEIVGQ